jgi:hypothetical protein
MQDHFFASGSFNLVIWLLNWIAALLAYRGRYRVLAEDPQFLEIGPLGQISSMKLARHVIDFAGIRVWWATLTAPGG